MAKNKISVLLLIIKNIEIISIVKIKILKLKLSSNPATVDNLNKLEFRISYFPNTPKFISFLFLF